jgi:hypothetical protein
MSCTSVSEPLRRLLDTPAEDQETPMRRLDEEAVTVALSYGWVYEYGDRVALTGAGAYHAGRERTVGLLE